MKKGVRSFLGRGMGWGGALIRMKRELGRRQPKCCKGYQSVHLLLLLPIVSHGGSGRVGGWWGVVETRQYKKCAELINDYR